MILKIVSPVFILVFISLQSQIGNCQIFNEYQLFSPYYNQSPAIGRTMGGATVALPDSVPSVYENPAGLGLLLRPKLFISIAAYKGYLDVNTTTEYSLKSYQWNEGPNIGIIAVSLPLKIFRHAFTVAGSYNGNIPYDYKQGKDSFSLEQPQYSGRLQTANLGLGIPLSSTLRFGVGWRHWFGEHKVAVPSYLGDRVITETFSYNGNVAYIGMQKDISPNKSFGIQVYLPFQLSIQNTSKIADGTPNKSEQVQNFSGALHLGYAHQIRSFKIGIGYEYQHKFDTRTQYQTDESRINYSGLSAFAGAVGYKFHFNKVSLPVYFMYKAAFLSEAKDETTFASMSSPQFDKNPTLHILEFGSNIHWRNFTVFFATQFKQGGKYLKYPPPVT